jgi:hypothetical protein
MTKRSDRLSVIASQPASGLAGSVLCDEAIYLWRMKDCFAKNACNDAKFLKHTYTPLYAENPPSTGMTTPVTKFDAGDRSHNTVPRRSSGTP